MESTLITAVDLKRFSSISENMDVNMLDPHLIIAQQLFIAPILGDALYSSILTQFDNQTISGDTLELLNDYIAPAIAFGAWFSAAPFIAYKTNRSGIQTQGSPDTVAVTSEELSLYISRVQNLKDFYCERLNKFLIDDNYVKFPLFRSDDTPVYTNKGSGLYLGFSRNRNRNCLDCNKQWWE